MNLLILTNPCWLSMQAGIWIKKKRVDLLIGEWWTTEAALKSGYSSYCLFCKAGHWNVCLLDAIILEPFPLQPIKQEPMAAYVKTPCCREMGVGGCRVAVEQDRLGCLD